ncbi:DUF3095 domain-containing protein [Chloroflexus sp.]|uniref:DUF3095 domain-containing protein n=1 Tax=Chloroflexus sp. TaxID=1904827 RepID=UPI00298EE913|nr:DUF3095 domain-containing protein [Chloroflexus sp.]MCS6888706.1 DUF3095 domain-containing protein [Chloroflexus sp.]MDW8404187.1 DUF3095 domain-containing protein [Chloroflexus sp.]
MAMTTSFFAEIPLLTRFSDIADLNAYRPLPSDWTVVICDVRGSTRAIAEGRYKEVNMIGAATITAALNVAGEIAIPFAFGGDGASLAVPPELAAATLRALSAVSGLAQQAFNLELRVGAVPARAILPAGYQVLVGRLALNQQVAQAVFSGGGISYAERLVKDEETAADFLVAPGNPDEANLSGLECRWDTIPPAHGAALCLIVQVLPQADPAATMAIYRAVIEAIEQIYGGDQAYHPLHYSLMQASAKPLALWPEARLRGGASLWAQLAYWAQTYSLNLGVRGYRWLQQVRGEVPWWDRYRQHVVTAADYRKYDDVLRMIISGEDQQHEQLLAWLEERAAAGELVFGAHRSPEVMLTCLVFERMGRQIHFVDGADGGFTLAALDFKQRLRQATLVSNRE